jgi:hypothetical protein
MHFGIAEETKVSTLEIDWPSGIRQTLRDVHADQYLTVNESAS